MTVAAFRLVKFSLLIVQGADVDPGSRRVWIQLEYRPATFMAPEGQSFECGAQDQGNELSLLLSETGAESFMDQKPKDEEESGPAGNA